MQITTSSIPEGHCPRVPSFQVGRASLLGQLSSTMFFNEQPQWPLILHNYKQKHQGTTAVLIQICLVTYNDDIVVMRWKSSLTESSPLRPKMQTVHLYNRGLLVPVSTSQLWCRCQCGQWNLLAQFPSLLASLSLLGKVQEKKIILNMKVGPPVFRFLTLAPSREWINRSNTSPKIWCVKQPSWATSSQRTQRLVLAEGQVGPSHRATYWWGREETQHEGEILKGHSSCTLANWGSSKCIIKMSLAHKWFLLTILQRLWLAVPPTLWSQYSTVFHSRHPQKSRFSYSSFY